MGTQGNNSNIDFSIVNLVDHPILFVDTTRPRLFKDVVLQVLHLTSASSRMLLKLHKHIRDFLDSGFVATLFDDGNFFLGLFRKQYSVSHFLQRIDKFGNVFFVFKTRELCSRLMSLSYIFLNSFHITRVGKERIARRTYLIRVNMDDGFSRLLMVTPLIAPKIFLRLGIRLVFSMLRTICVISNHSLFVCKDKQNKRNNNIIN